MFIKGEVQGMRVVTGLFVDGKKSGQQWHFLSLEIVDATTREVCSCQLRDADKDYLTFVDAKKEAGQADGGNEVHTLRKEKDLTGHVVKVVVLKFSSGERSILQQVVRDPSAQSAQSVQPAQPEKRIGYEPRAVVVTRFTVTNIVDEGLPKYDE